MEDQTGRPLARIRRKLSVCGAIAPDVFPGDSRNKDARAIFNLCGFHTLSFSLACYTSCLRSRWEKQRSSVRAKMYVSAPASTCAARRARHTFLRAPKIQQAEVLKKKRFFLYRMRHHLRIIHTVRDDPLDKKYHRPFSIIFFFAQTANRIKSSIAPNGARVFRRALNGPSLNLNAYSLSIK